VEEHEVGCSSLATRHLHVPFHDSGTAVPPYSIGCLEMCRNSTRSHARRSVFFEGNCPRSGDRGYRVHGFGECLPMIDPSPRPQPSEFLQIPLPFFAALGDALPSGNSEFLGGSKRGQAPLCEAPGADRRVVWAAAATVPDPFSNEQIAITPPADDTAG